LSMRMRFTVISSVSRHVRGPLTRSPSRLGDGSARKIWTGVAQGVTRRWTCQVESFSGGAKARRCHRIGAGRRARGSGRVLVPGRQPRCGWLRRACRGRD
jgi:hypothetical protein